MAGAAVLLIALIPMSAVSQDILTLPPPAADARLPYGGNALQFGDLRVPAGPGPHPVAVVIHGGFWRAAYNLEHIGHLCAALTRAGVATWSIEYRRIGDAGGGWPGTFEDVARGADHVRALATKYRLDLRRVVAIGHSAGGHLALFLAARRRIPAASPLHIADPLALAGAVSLGGVADLRRAFELRLSRNVVADLLGGSPADVPERYRSASPMELLPLGVPQTLVHGVADDIVPIEISRGYESAAKAKGERVRLVALEGVGHFEVIDPRSRVWKTVEDSVLAMLRVQ